MVVVREPENGPEAPRTRRCGIHESMPYSSLITTNGRPDRAALRPQATAARIFFAVALCLTRPQSSASGPVTSSRGDSVRAI